MQKMWGDLQSVGLSKEMKKMTDSRIHKFECRECIKTQLFPCKVEVESYGFVDPPTNCPWEDCGNNGPPKFKRIGVW